MQLKSADQFLDCEMMLKAERMGLTICSIDVEFHKREAGESSIGWRDCWDYVRNLVTILVSRNDPWGIHRIPNASQKAQWVHQATVANPDPAAAFTPADLPVRAK
jgi:hypothetical protein